MKTKKVWMAIRVLDNREEITMFDSYDEIFGLYDYTEEAEISIITYEKITSDYDYYLSRYGNTFRAYSC